MVEKAGDVEAKANLQPLFYIRKIDSKYSKGHYVMSWSHVTSHVIGLTRSGQFKDQYWSRTPSLT